MPSYLRFVRGVIDSADLPLNISREMLQQSPLIAKIRSGTVNRLLKELKNRSKDYDDYKNSGMRSALLLKKAFMKILPTAPKLPSCRVSIRRRILSA